MRRSDWDNYQMGPNNLVDWRINQRHVLKMLKAFYNIYGKWIEVGKRRRDGKRKYFIFNK